MTIPPAGHPSLSDEWLRGIFDSASDGILATDASQTIVAANAASARMFRCTVADLVGSPLDRLIPERHRAAHRQHVQAFGDGRPRARTMGGGDVGRTVTALRFDGEEFPIEASISCAEVAGQRLYTVVHRDISELRRAAAALRDSQQLLAATFSASSVAMAQMEPGTRRLIAVNAAMCRLSGYSEAELLRMTPDDLNHPDHRLDTGKVEALVWHGAPYREEKRIVRKDGAVVWVEVTGSVVRDADGRPLRLVGLMQDNTARHRAEEALRASEARQSFLVRLNDRLRQLDDPQAIAYEAACLLGEFLGASRVGYGQDDGNGETISPGPQYAVGVPLVSGPCRYADFGPALLEAMDRGHTLIRRDIAREPDLSPVHRAAFAAMQLAAAVDVPLRVGSHVTAVLFVHAAAPRDWTADEVTLIEDVARRIRADIERLQAEAAMRSARSRLQTALDSMIDAVFISDAEGRFLEFNDAFVSFHRFRRRADCRQTLAEYPEILEVFMPDGSVAPLEQWAVPRALRGETATNQEYRVRRKDTGESWVGSYSLAPIRAEDGRIVGSVVTARDITSIKRTQEELATSHAMLQRLVAEVQRAQEDERKRIARELHDDLQQSLAAIRMDAVVAGERVARGQGDIAPLLDRIDRLSGAAIESTRRIVNDLRPEMLEELGLIPALEALCAEHARRAGLDCRCEVAGFDAAAPLDGRALSIGLYRIVQEALNNVAKHARASQVTVQIHRSRDGAVVLRIADNGVGLRPRDTRNTRAFGLLGMTERVRALGGQLRIEATPERGTLIEATVPVEPVDAPAPGPADAGAGATARAEPPPASADDLSGQPLQAVIDALDGNVAVLDPSGVVQLVNQGWRDFAARHGAADLKNCGPGASYLDVCRRSAVEDPGARQVLQGLSAVLDGRDDSFAIEYPCTTPTARLWFRMHAATIRGGWTMVTHVAIHCPASEAGAAAVRD